MADTLNCEVRVRLSHHLGYIMLSVDLSEIFHFFKVTLVQSAEIFLANC
jgi:hypothetical protein